MKNIFIYLTFCLINISALYSQTYPLEWNSIPTNDWGGITKFAINGNYLFVGTSNKGVFRNNMTTQLWEEVFTDTKLKSINFMKVFNSRLYLHHTNYASTEQQKIFYSSNNGSSWLNRTLSISSNSFSATNIQMHDNILYFPSANGYGSSDMDVSVVSRLEVKDFETAKTYIIKDLEFSYMDSIYSISYGNGFFSTLNNSDSWYRINKTEPSKLYTCMTLDSNNIYLGTEDKGVYKYNFLNGEYKSMNFNLGFMNITSIIVCYGRLYISTANNGIYYFDTKQNKWFDVNTNLPNLKIKSMQLHDNTLFALTFDDKIFKAVVPEPIPIITLEQLTKNIFCANTGIKINFTVTDYFFKPDNVYSVLLSDSAGNFVNPKILSTKKARYSDSISVIFPDSLPISKLYRIKVIASNPLIESNVSVDKLTINPLPYPALTGETKVCSKKEYTYFATRSSKNIVTWEITDGKFIFKNNDSAIVIWDDISTGNLKITESTPALCRTTVSLPVNITITPNKPKISKINDTLFVEANEGIQWYFNNTELLGAKGQKIAISSTGYYKVKIDNFNGCPSEYSEEFYAEKPINDIHPELSESLLISPNPASDYIIYKPIDNNYKFEIYNQIGFNIKSLSSQIINNESVKIDIISLPKGIYYIIAGNNIQKFIKI